MDYEKTLEELKHMKVETGSFVCLGCGHEHNCSVHGCAILRDTVECIEEMKRVLRESEAARADLGKRLEAAEKELHETKSELEKYREAEQDGRLVVLPCKVGDTIYYTREGCPIVEHLKVRTFFVGDPTRRGEILHLHMIRTDKFDVSIDALGKTVFLTREEAEAALAQKGGKHEANSV